jgi:PAS domain S-box-containing protein
MTKRRILIVEDEMIVAEDLSQLLEERGYEVVGTAVSGERAVELAKETKPHLVLLDIKLRGTIDGIEAANRISAHLDVAIIYLTAHTEQDLFERAKATKPYGYLSKPVSPSELMRTVEMVLYKHEMERRLKESELRYKTLVEESYDGILVHDRSAIVFANSRLHEMLRYEPGELLGQDPWLICHPDDQAVSKERASSRIRGEKVANRYEIRFVRKDGTWFEGEVNAKAIRFDGEPGVQVWVRDISQQKRAQEQLRESEEKLRGMIANLHDAFYRTDMNGTLLFLSPSSERVAGYTPEDAVGRNIAEFYTDPSERQEFMRLMLENGYVNGFEARLVRKDGGIVWVSTSARFFKDKDGNIAGVEGISRDVTEHKRMEMALKESEERYRILAENSLTGIYVYQDEKLVYTNEFAAKSLGFLTQELIGKSIWEIVAPDDRDLVRNVVASRWQGEAAGSQYEFRVLTKSEEMRWVQVLATEIQHDGRPAILGNVIDITDRKHAEEALRQSEARYRDLFENASDIIYTHDLKGNYTSANQAARRILGYGPEEFLRMNYRDVVDPESLPAAEENFRKKTVNGVEATPPYEIRVRAKDGTPFWFEVTSRVLRDNGIAVGVHGSARNITDRKRAEEALKESEEKYRVLVENANEAIFVAQDGKLQFANPKTMELIGHTEQELTSEPFVKFIHPDDRALVAERHVRRMRGEELPSVYPFRVIDKSGTIRWVEISAVSIDWERRPATLNFLVDITFRRKMEEELIKVQKLESLGILAGGIAHDFNNILTTILGNISIARMRSQFSDDSTNTLRAAEEGCLRAKALTQQLLTFSKGGAPVKRIMLISQLIKNSCEFALRGSSVRCEFSIPEDLWAVDVDEGQIGQVLNNLIINADHAMPQGGVIQVQAENMQLTPDHSLPLSQGNYVRLTIKDQGIGIPAEILPRIFDPYFTTKYKGSGLGLAISHSIITNHGGFLTVTSEPATGTTFCIYLPRSKRGVSSPASLHDVVITGGGRILLMDDDKSIRDLASGMMSALGYEAVTAEDGARAIELYQQSIDNSRPFDVVILDLTVAGGMGGLEALKTLRQMDPDLKAVVSSGYSNDPIMSDYRKHGFDGVVAKPYTVEELGVAISKLITKKVLPDSECAKRRELLP